MNRLAAPVAMLTGIVYMNAYGEKITAPAVTITNLTTGATVISDVNGRYTIRAKRGDQIRFTYVGYRPLLYTVLSSFYTPVLEEENIGIEPVEVNIVKDKKKTPWGWILGGLAVLGVVVMGSKKTKKYTIK